MIQKTLLLLAVLLFSAVTITAQANINGALKGRTTDATDASIGGASVRLTSTETGKEFSAISDEAGNYSFPVVAPGVYRLTIEKQNFKRLVRENIVITVGETATANVALSIGEISETITVEGGADIVQTNSAEISQLVNLAPGVGGIIASSSVFTSPKEQL